MTHPPLDEIRARAHEHAKQIESVHWLGVKELATHWGVSAATVRKIPRAQLPYLLFGESAIRRYEPRDIEQFETTMKHDSPFTEA